MEKELIEKINKIAPNDQGIFTEPFGVPDKLKEPVIYMRWETGGVSGGGYHEHSTNYRYTNPLKPKFKVLDLVLIELKPNLTYLQYREIEDLIVTSEKTEWEYYGNSTDYEVQYIVLSDLERMLESF